MDTQTIINAIEVLKNILIINEVDKDLYSEATNKIKELIGKI